MDLTIEQAAARDIDGVARLYGDVCDYLADKTFNPGWEKGFFPAEENARLFLQQNALYVARVNGRIAGSFALTHNPSSEPEDYGTAVEKDYARILFVHVFVVHPAYLRKGVGSAMLRFAEGLAKERGMTALRLYVWEHNTVAIRVYEHYGFQYLGREDIGLSAYGLPWFHLYEKETGRQR